MNWRHRSRRIGGVVVGAALGSGYGSGAAALDIENVIAMAPGSDIHVYEGPGDTDAQIAGEYDDMVAPDVAKTLSTSWGDCEQNEDSTLISSENTVFEEAAAYGQTLYAASDDDGSEDCLEDGTSNAKALAVDDPGSQPYVVSVGGLTLESLTPTEKVWNDKSDGDGDGAGRGGISTKWLRPTWQTGVGVITKHSSNAPCGASTNSYCREVPDVSADADPDTGGWVFYFEGERLGGEGGTSAASPLWAALTAVINSQCTSGTVGFDAPTLYWAASTAGNFTDVTAGNNDYTGTHDGLYPANAGFDMASGLGSPLASGLAKSLCVPPPSVSKISPNEGAPAGGTVVTITGSNLARAIAVDFGSTPATSYTVKSATQITATSPALSAGTDNVTVTTAGGTSATGSADDFTYTTAPPVVSALSPKEGPTTGGTSVTITGSDFGGTTKVLFGTLSATSFTVKSATQIIAVSPAQAAATVNVSVTTPNGTSSAVSADDFTYT